MPSERAWYKCNSDTFFIHTVVIVGSFLSSAVKAVTVNDSYFIPVFHVGKLKSWELKLHSAGMPERGEQLEQPDIRTVTVQLKFISAPWSRSLYLWGRGNGLRSLLWSI